MKQIIQDLYKLPRYLLGEGYDQALSYINNIIPLEVIEVASGTKLGGGWTVPQEWVLREAWIKFNGEKILDWEKDKLCVHQGSEPVHLKMTREEVEKKIYYSSVRPNATPYNYKLYNGGWGFDAPRDFVKTLEGCEGGICVPELQSKMIVEGDKDKFVSNLKEGEYEVFIDSEYKPGMMKIGIHTISGKTDKEILLFAHLDHPWQANDNLSAVAGLIDMAGKLKEKGFEHTIKLIFCPETIGSIAYGETQDISKVDFVVALDCIGNEGDILFQKSFDVEQKINRVMQLAVFNQGTSYVKGNFRQLIGSDENYFCDPKIGIGAVMISRWGNDQGGYPQYHTSDDTPEIIKEEQVQKVQNIILKCIEIWEKDFIPTRNFKGALFRSSYGLHTPLKELNLTYDHLIYAMDGKLSLAELCCIYGQDFDGVYEAFLKVEKDGLITRKNENSSTDISKGKKQKTTRKK